MTFKFARTVWANKELAKLCPNHDIKRLGELFTIEDFNEQVIATQKMMLIMNEAYIRRFKFEHRGEEPDSAEMTMEALDNMTDEEIGLLMDKMVETMAIDDKTSVDAEPKKDEAKEQTLN